MTDDTKPEVFTSYAQNFEDVVLWRALKHVPVGLYIDIGAQHPVLDSVSKAFYEHGWRGIHVEPVPHYAAMIREDRPGEQVLQVALSEQEGVMELYVIGNSGLSTGVKAFAELHQEKHGFAHEVIQTPVLTMKTAFASLAGRDVHWLKIDVEGFEEQVLRGWDSKTLRPWIIVIEATVPMSTELRYEGADRVLVDSGYEFAYFDGLNRFYVAAEHRELATKLQVPPNVFDEAQLSGLSGTWCVGAVARVRAEMQDAVNQLSTLRDQAIAKVHHAEERALQAEAKAAQAEAKAALVEARVVQLNAQTAQSEARASQADVRMGRAEERAKHLEARVALAEERARLAERTLGRRLITAARDGRLLEGGKRRVKSALRLSATAVNRSPALGKAARSIIGLIPPLKRRLSAVLATESTTVATPGSDTQSPDTLITLRQLAQSQRGQESP
ncbi:FkbM family methyltransferase [Variovorax paradoxus]|uniref:FkbM family methyltransferase n=1 Tax=Variovorax paradoxus TaxID=34073 RepID=UPI002790986B|nr:FkbM family methyltransferase [Variovorax paradoxus]MDQ0572420.1 FkbM family methyltransferase [Variovorax paradoxus]